MRQHLTTLAIVAVCLVGLAGPADAQTQTRVPVIPPAGGSWSTRGPVPSMEILPPGAMVPPNAGGLPDRAPAPASANQVRPSGEGLQSMARAPQRYWSQRSAMWESQQRLRELAPLHAADRGGLPAQGAGLTGALPQGHGLSGSQFGLDPLARYSPAGKLAQPLPTQNQNASPANDDAPPAGQAAEPVPNEVNIPFEQFETYEEFRTWLAEQLSQPDGGAVGRALLQDEAFDAPAQPQPQQGRPVAAPRRVGRPDPERRPPIGYVGVGSHARAPIGTMQFGSNLQQESARLVTELNQYLRQNRASRTQRQRVQQDGRVLPPPPHSDLGRRLEASSARSGLQMRSPHGFAPQAQPRQYWQNLGGYQLPSHPGPTLSPY